MSNPTLDELRKANPTLAKAVEEELRRQDERKVPRSGGCFLGDHDRCRREGGALTEPRCFCSCHAPELAATVAPPEPARATFETPALLSRRRRLYSAVPTVCSAGHRHPSKVEARVCAVVRAELDPMDERLLLQVRLGLPALAGDDDDRALYFTVDFAIVRGGRWHRFIDAKSGRRRSPEWLRGRKACEASYGLKVEEIQA